MTETRTNNDALVKALIAEGYLRYQNEQRERQRLLDEITKACGGKDIIIKIPKGGFRIDS